MKHLLTACAAVLVTFGLCAAQEKAVAQTAAAAAADDYESWVAPFRGNSAEKRFLLKEPRSPEPLPKLVIIVVIEKSAAEKDGKVRFPGDDRSSSGWKISHEGTGEWFSHNWLGTKGGCCSQIEKDRLGRMDHLLARLPDDNSRLPPKGRRLVLQIPEGGNFKVRVYDLMNLPDEVLELLRLAKTGIRSGVLWFDPEIQWAASEHSLDGGLAVTSDGRQIISSGLNGPIKIWDADTRSLAAEFSKPQNVPFNGLVLSPDDSIAVIDGWGEIGVLDMTGRKTIRVIEEPIIDRKRHQLSNPRFIKNGEFLLVESSEPALHIYDTKTWRRASGLPEIPPEAISYYPARKTKLAVYQSRNGQILLEGAREERNPVVLAEAAELKYAAFSSDESMVSVVTVPPATGNVRTRYRIRIWKTSDGKFLKELMPFERDFCESVEGLRWSPDDKYLLAANKSDHFFTSRGISVWNVRSGRHRGELQGCPTNMNGFDFLPGKNKIVALCGDGQIRVWDFAAALGEIRRLEARFAGN